MEKLLLVLGDVTPEQCEPAKLKMRQEGIALKIARMNPEDFLWSEATLMDVYLTPRQRGNTANMPKDDLDELVSQLITQYFQRFSPPIGAVVMDEPTWEKWEEFMHLTEVLSVKLSADRWIVRSDGKVEYAG